MQLLYAFQSSFGGIKNTDRSKAVFLLWIPFCYLCFVSVMLAVLSVHCSLVVSSWERADLLALVCDVFLCFYHFPMWCPGSGVVLDCIDSGSLPSSLLSYKRKQYVFLNHNLTRLDLYNDFPKYIISNQKGESISIQRVKLSALLSAVVFWKPL